MLTVGQKECVIKTARRMLEGLYQGFMFYRYPSLTRIADLRKSGPSE